MSALYLDLGHIAPNLNATRCRGTTNHPIEVDDDRWVVLDYNKSNVVDYKHDPAVIAALTAHFGPLVPCEGRWGGVYHYSNANDSHVYFRRLDECPSCKSLFVVSNEGAIECEETAEYERGLCFGIQTAISINPAGTWAKLNHGLPGTSACPDDNTLKHFRQRYSAFKRRCRQQQRQGDETAMSSTPIATPTPIQGITEAVIDGSKAGAAYAVACDITELVLTSTGAKKLLPRFFVVGAGAKLLPIVICYAITYGTVLVPGLPKAALVRWIAAYAAKGAAAVVISEWMPTIKTLIPQILGLAELHGLKVDEVKQ